MDPLRTAETHVSSICRRLRITRIPKSRLLDCALCGKRVAAMDELAIRHGTEGVPICRSCFELVLKKAVQTLECGKPGVVAPAAESRPE
jgi:hypothetical protein